MPNLEYSGNLDQTITTDTTAPDVTRSSVAIELITQHSQVVGFDVDGFRRHQRSHGWEIESVFLWLLKNVPIRGLFTNMFLLWSQYGYIIVVWEKHADSYSCSCSRVNSNYERTVSCAGYQWRTPGPRISQTTPLLTTVSSVLITPP